MRGVEMADARHTQDDHGDASVHRSVLVREVTVYLGGESPATLEGWVVDGTLGAGGHAAALLEACPHVRLIGIDQDPQILAHARERLAPFGSRAFLHRARISGLDRLLHEAGAGRVVAMLFDLGASSLQLDTKERGFSFAEDAPLDMRMDSERERTAADIVNRWDEADLADLFFHEGGETRSRRVARAIAEARRQGPILRTLALSDLVARALGGGRGPRAKIHPATRVFQALRRAVNEEGEELRHGLAIAERWLVDGGHLAVISFHSGEDGVVKRFLQTGKREGRWALEPRKPVRAGEDEVRENRRARSAALRLACRTRRMRAPASKGARRAGGPGGGQG